MESSLRIQKKNDDCSQLTLLNHWEGGRCPIDWRQVWTVTHHFMPSTFSKLFHCLFWSTRHSFSTQFPSPWLPACAEISRTIGPDVPCQSWFCDTLFTSFLLRMDGRGGVQSPLYLWRAECTLSGPPKLWEQHMKSMVCSVVLKILQIQERPSQHFSSVSRWVVFPLPNLSWGRLRRFLHVC